MDIVNRELSLVSSWFRASNKFQFVKRLYLNFQIKIDNTPISRVDSTKFLATSYPGSFFGKDPGSAGHVAPTFWVLN
jgi:hypothetical protein